jgi:radical SAM superfamily enzyme YgiQ (UPF0313 family)
LLIKLPEPTRATQKPCYMPPIGLWSMAHNLSKWFGETVKIIDCHIDGLEAFEKHTIADVDVVGISAQFSIQHEAYKHVAKMAKFHGKRVVAGGFHAAAVPAPQGVDKVIRGDGELGMVQGKTWEDIDYPRPSAADMEPYWQRNAPHDLQSKTKRWMPMEFSRGCWHNCGYCGVKTYWGTPRYFSREKISKYLDGLVSEGIEEIFIEDDNVISDKKYFTWILGELAMRGIWWSTPNGISAAKLRPFVPFLASSKCWRVSLPFETGSPKTASLMKLGGKWLDLFEANALVESLRDQGIKTCGFFIIGYPGETLGDMQRTLNYANTLNLDQRNIYIATPYPGTPLYYECKAKGYLTKDGEALYRDLLYTKGLIRTPDFEPEQVEELKAKDRAVAIERKSLTRG